MAKAKTQNDQRTEVDIADQFKRVWHGCLEIATGDPTGAFNRVGWKDPLRTPMFFLKMQKGTVLGFAWTLLVDFPAWVAQQTEAEEQWYRSLHQIARDQYKRVDPSEIPTLEHDAYVRNLAGPKPWPSSRVVAAAGAGDRQYLGLEPLDKEHREALGLTTLTDMGANVAQIANAPAKVAAESSDAIPVPPDTYPEFVAWAMRWDPNCKGNLSAVAARWKEHRENLKAAAV